ncbi:ABC transporter ATP-binding protein [Blastococcus sp. SYSU D00820]
MTDAVLTVRGLTVRYGKAVAVDGLDLVAPAGQVTALVGPNGAGKSSTLLGIYGSVPAQGTVLLEGEDIGRMSATRRARAGLMLVPQGRQLFPKMSVEENLRLMAELLRLPGKVVGEALDRFPILRERSRSLAGVLSGGEQQMLVVSRALMSSPKVLLLDEMMTGLAPKIVSGLADTVAELARKDGVAVVMADPSLGPVRRVVDRGYVLLRGRVVAEEADAVALDRAYQRTMGVVQEEVEAEAEAGPA